MEISSRPDLLRTQFLDIVCRNSLADCDPEHLVEAWFTAHPEFFSNQGSEPKRVWVFGAGKAVLSMGLGTLECLEKVQSTKNIELLPGVLVAPQDQRVPEAKKYLQPLEKAGFQMEWGTHPHPTDDSIHATQKLLEKAQDVKPGDAVLFLLSGGASALLCSPADGLTVDEKAKRIAALMQSGLPIEAINAERAKLSKIKSGGLVRAFQTAAENISVLVLNDVVGADLQTVGSGPFAKSGAKHFEIGNCLLWMERAVVRAREWLKRSGYSVDVLGDATPVTGDVEELAEAWAKEVREKCAKVKRPLLLVRVGEPTVRAPAHARFDHGGRAQHFALSMAQKLEQVPGWQLLTCASDGRDAETMAAGAIVLGSTWPAIQMMSMGGSLENFQSHLALMRIRVALVTGKTFNNINDLFLLLVNPLESEPGL